jgi:hypothetical protein
MENITRDRLLNALALAIQENWLIAKRVGPLPNLQRERMSMIDLWNSIAPIDCVGNWVEILPSKERGQSYE